MPIYFSRYTEKDECVREAARGWPKYYRKPRESFPQSPPSPPSENDLPQTQSTVFKGGRPYGSGHIRPLRAGAYQAMSQPRSPLSVSQPCTPPPTVRNPPLEQTDKDVFLADLISHQYLYKGKLTSDMSEAEKERIIKQAEEKYNKAWKKSPYMKPSEYTYMKLDQPPMHELMAHKFGYKAKFTSDLDEETRRIICESCKVFPPKPRVKETYELKKPKEPKLIDLEDESLFIPSPHYKKLGYKFYKEYDAWLNKQNPDLKEIRKSLRKIWCTHVPPKSAEELKKEKTFQEQAEKLEEKFKQQPPGKPLWQMPRYDNNMHYMPHFTDNMHSMPRSNNNNNCHLIINKVKGTKSCTWVAGNTDTDFPERYKPLMRELLARKLFKEMQAETEKKSAMWAKKRTEFALKSRPTSAPASAVRAVKYPKSCAEPRTTKSCELRAKAIAERKKLKEPGIWRSL